MKQLRTIFTGIGEVKGFEFTQIKKTQYGYIYEVNTGENIHYEVFKYKENTRYNCVSYPKNRSFGVWAWTCGDLHRAYEILDELKPF